MSALYGELDRRPLCLCLIVARSSRCSPSERTFFTFEETFKSVGSGKTLLAAITSVSALFSQA